MMRDQAACSKHPSRRRVSGLIAVVTSVALLASACSGDDDDDDVLSPPNRGHHHGAGTHRGTGGPGCRRSAAGDRRRGWGHAVARGAHDGARRFCDATRATSRRSTATAAVQRSMPPPSATSRRSAPTSSTRARRWRPSVNGVEEAKAALAAAGQELADAQAALARRSPRASSVPTSSTTPATTTTTTLVPPATIERSSRPRRISPRPARGSRRRPHWPRRRPSTTRRRSRSRWPGCRLLRRGRLPHRRAAGQGGRAGDRVHDEAADRAATVGYYDGPIDGIYGPATVRGEATAGRQ